MNKKQKQNVKVLSGVFAVAAGMVIASAMHASPAYASFAAKMVNSSRTLPHLLKKKFMLVT